MTVPEDEATPLIGDQRGSSSYTDLPSDGHSPDNDSGEETASELEGKPSKTSGEKVAIIATLLLGIFLANADGTLVIAQTAAITSEFGHLEGSEWLMGAYFLASCAAQSIVGKLSDIFGRKQMLLWSYALFVVGNLITGAGSNLWQILVGRAFAGAGSAGMLSLVSILLADLVSIRTLAAWRGYVNVVATTGRAVGGPLGGVLADTVGWRWSFYGQCPVTSFAFFLVLRRLPGTQDMEEDLNESKWKRQSNKLRRIDFLGATTIIIATVCFLLALQFGSKDMSWASARAIVPFAASIMFGAGFVAIEKYWATEPVFPIRLMIHRDIITTYPVTCLQTVAQMGLMYAIPLYFQVSSRASAVNAGSRLVPAIVGNAVGGLLCGFVIHGTGKYKLLTLFGLAFACLGYLLIILRWHGNTNWAESLYIFPGGFGAGVATSTTFIAITAGVAPSDIAVAGAGSYQAMGIGAALGSSITMSVLQAALRPMLGRALSKVGASDEVPKRSIEDISYVTSLRGPLREIVVRCYVRSLTYTHVASLCFSFLAFLITLTWREHKL